MSLNLIRDRWIPVILRDNAQRVIRPDEIADPEVFAPDWPRADLNVACLEFLIGLICLADPPRDFKGWDERLRPNAVRLRERLERVASAFELGGDGPRFLQDFDSVDGEENPPDMLFIDSAGSNTAKNNADLMVRRNRYPSLEASLAAMALYTFQAHAPAGGAGNRTSMRGGGPLVTLIDPRSRREGGAKGCLWDLIWANVPYGVPQGPEVLPWMKPTRTSEKGQQTFPHSVRPNGLPSKLILPEVFFGMPRRLRLVFDADGQVKGVVQRPYGTNYAGWDHPLTPYYRQKAGSELLPVHPRAGAFGYRNWLGVVMDASNSDLKSCAYAVRDFDERASSMEGRVSVLVAGYAMDNMRPRDFVLSREPFVRLNDENARLLRGMIDAAELYGLLLRGALKTICADGSKLEAMREEFFLKTQSGFNTCLGRLEQNEDRDEVAKTWLGNMRKVALAIFNAEAMPVLAGLEMKQIGKVVDARSMLLGAFIGRGKMGGQAFVSLEIEREQA